MDEPIISSPEPPTDIIHRSKIGMEILLPTIFILGTVLIITIVNAVWFGILICGLGLLLLINIYKGTVYRITADKRLLIKCGIIEQYDIDVMEIEWVKATHEITSAPALSIDRLEVNYKGGRVLVSPKDKKKFVSDLKRLNPRIWG